ncbi:DedA family protein [Saccharopolyspora sp. NPDC002686]|uniref:DedA family protein n=1 Tax=Saccharopolyspora sp. NPDC002686 TaxID=3154541 RepID=UPI003328BF1A
MRTSTEGAVDLGELLSSLAQLPLPLVIAAAGALTLAECTIGLGMVIPGETGLLIAASAITDVFGFVAMVLVVTLCATTGDTIGYWLGHRYGQRLRETKLVGRIGRQHWDRAADQLRKHGAGAVFVGRFLPVLRTLTPAASGASDLRFRRFLPASAAGALCWSTLHVGIGTGAGASARYVEDVLGEASWFVLIAVVAVVVAVVLWRKVRARRTAAEAARTPRAEQ